MVLITFYKDIFSLDKPHYNTVDYALERIRLGKSRATVEQIREAAGDKALADRLKKKLPAICFSGKFTERKDDLLQEHSGFIILDFDDVQSIADKNTELINHPFVYACWVSPRGNGIKALVKIADPTKHREHFAALREIFPDADKSGVNPSRVCYESYDPFIYINKNATLFTKLLTIEKIEAKEVLSEHNDNFNRLIKWLTNKNDAFAKGNRNFYIFKLASACCRFGIDENIATNLILMEYPASNDFTAKECANAVKSGYRASKSKFGSSCFERDVLVEKKSRKEVEIDPAVFDEAIKARDVIFGSDVKASAMSILRSGYESVLPVGVPTLDKHFKLKKGEITCVTGIGNYGKSTFFKWYLLIRVLVFGEKFALFAPEDNPAEEFYHDLVEIYLGCDCTPRNPYKPNDATYAAAYDFISSHFFYLYPKDLTPTPDYIKERFLELIIKEKVSGVIVDPFNQMQHDYGSAGGRTDKYLETVFGDFSRFAQANSVYFIIVAHPKQMKKSASGNYECPDVFDLNDGAMWNNKMDNILVYHRPFMQTAPDDPTAEFHSKKIRRQKTVGAKGFFTFEYIRKTRRYEFEGIDPVSDILRAQDQKQNKSFFMPVTPHKSSINFYETTKDDDTVLEEPPF